MSASEERSTADLWRSLNFPLLLEEMSNTLEVMVQSRARSLESKKQLAEDTKALLRRGISSSHSEEESTTTAAAAPLSQWNELLKDYQHEIDNLSRRAKQAETSFNKLYQLLKPLPDPVSAMATTLTNATDEHIDELSNTIRRKDDEIVRLTSKLADLETEFSTLTNQAVTVRRLKEALKAKDDEADEKVQAALSQQEEEFTTRLQHHHINLDDRIQRLQQELDNERDRRKEAESLITRAEEERRHYSKMSEDSLQALTAENETLAADIDRLTGEVEALRIQTKSTHGMDRTLELQQERQRNEALEAELVTVRSKADADREERLNTINHLQQECLDLADEIKMVTERLRQEEKEVARLKDVEGDLQKCQATLEKMKIVEYSADPSEGSTELERMLLGKVRNLEGQLVPLRAKASEVSTIADKLRQREEEVSMLKESLDRLEKLGNDASLPYTTTTPSSLSTVEDPPSLMAITRQQRDHLRARVLTLEAERDSLREEVGDKTRKCDTLYTDNIKLLEQKKYWQSMSGLSTSSSTSSSNGIESILPRHASSEDDVIEMRYMPAYMEEVSLSPFETFKISEREKRLMRLPRGERLLVQVLTLIVGNRMTRIAGGLYLMALHLLVFIVLYKFMHLSSKYDNV